MGDDVQRYYSRKNAGNDARKNGKKGGDKNQVPPGLARRRGWVPGIRIRVLAIALIPSTALVVTGSAATAYLVSQGLSARNFATQTLNWSGPVSSYLADVMRERALSLQVLGGDPQAPAALQKQWTVTNAGLIGASQIASSLKSISPMVVASIGPETVQLANNLSKIRQAVLARQVTATDVDNFYTQLADVGIGAFLLVAPVSPNPVSATDLIDTMDFYSPVDLHSRAAGLAAGWVAQQAQPRKGTRPQQPLLSQANRQALEQLTFSYHYMLRGMTPRLTPSEQAGYTRLTSGSAWHTAVAGENSLVEQGRLGMPEASWLSAENQVSGQLFSLWQDNFRTGLNAAEAAANQRLRSSVLLGSAALGLTVAAFVAALILANRLVGRLRRLRSRTLELAAAQLPSLVGRIAQGQGVEVDREIPPLDYGPDEIGQVAEAFNAAQRTAIAAAVAEAKTRSGVAAVFMDIAHRSQVVVHRQLELLDVAEGKQNDPEHLELLFQLDHLATRARRNAENLLILGGGQPGRKWRGPVSLEDVVRSAVSETEQFARVSTVRLPGVRVVAAVVADLSHLVAELVDNATAFSPPESQVWVRGNVVGRGVAVEVEDQGLGLEAEDRERLNETLRNTPDFQVMAIAGQRNLGLFVVGQLAKRHGIRVTLLESAYGGVRAVVLIPRSSLEPEGTGDDGTAAPGQRAEVRPERLPGERAEVEQVETVVFGGDGAQAPQWPGQDPPVTATAMTWETFAGPPPDPADGNGQRTGSVNGQAAGQAWRGERIGGTGSHRAPGPQGRGRPPLPRRERQASLPQELRQGFAGGTAPAGPRPAPRSPEQARGSMSAFQRGTRLGRDHTSRDNQ